MTGRIGAVALLVRDYDEAIEWFKHRVGFMLIEDSPRDGGGRWVVMAPLGEGGARLLLARAASPEQESRIGNQTGGRVFLFLRTADFWGDYRRMRSAGVDFLEEPRHETYGTVAVFRDLYGNKWDLVGEASAPPA